MNQPPFGRKGLLGAMRVEILSSGSSLAESEFAV
jgi:hypothetical protein